MANVAKVNKQTVAMATVAKINNFEDSESENAKHHNSYIVYDHDDI